MTCCSALPRASRVQWLGRKGPARIRLIPVHDRNGKPPRPTDGSNAETAAADRRRIARIQHDDRGTATVEWVNVPGDLERTALSIEDARPESSPEKGYDPYALEPAARRGLGKPALRTGQTSRTDLRKLSEWIKKMRELEARKQRGEPDDED